MRKTDFTRHKCISATYECNIRNCVVGCTEGTLTDERCLFLQFSCYTVYLCGLQTLVERERGKNGGQSFCHHTLSTTGTAYKNDIVSTSRRHFEGTFHVFLSFYVCKVQRIVSLVGEKLLSGVHNSWLKGGLPAEEIGHFVQFPYAINS